MAMIILYIYIYIYIYIKTVSRIFALDVTVSDISISEILDNEQEIVRQCYRVQQWQWRHSMATVRIYKRHVCIAIFDVIKVRVVQTIVAHRHAETNKVITIGNQQMCVKIHQMFAKSKTMVIGDAENF